MLRHALDGILAGHHEPIFGCSYEELRKHLPLLFRNAKGIAIGEVLRTIVAVDHIVNVIGNPAVLYQRKQLHPPPTKDIHIHLALAAAGLRGRATAAALVPDEAHHRNRLHLRIGGHEPRQHQGQQNRRQNRPAHGHLLLCLAMTGSSSAKPQTGTGDRPFLFEFANYFLPVSA